MFNSSNVKKCDLHDIIYPLSEVIVEVLITGGGESEHGRAEMVTFKQKNVRTDFQKQDQVFPEAELDWCTEFYLLITD